jgi:hypothetical protein
MSLGTIKTIEVKIQLRIKMLAMFTPLKVFHNRSINSGIYQEICFISSTKSGQNIPEFRNLDNFVFTVKTLKSLKLRNILIQNCTLHMY